jgi:hypothetical protein
MKLNNYKGTKCDWAKFGPRLAHASSCNSEKGISVFLRFGAPILP